MLEYTLRRVRFTQSITVQSEPAILFILYYIYFIYIHKKEKTLLFIMKKEKSWSVNVPKLFAINILFTG